jgi:pimeloyl-ACP methyl ester carboxylesterase
MIGSPMDASGFASLAEHFRDRTVVTYDPRGIGRSERTDDAGESTPEQHADDLHRLIAALGGGPVDLFASSGGAVNALALVVRPDFDALRAASTRIVIGVGAESEGELAHRAGAAVAERLGTKAVTFPSHHGGFLGGEFGWGGDPDAFAVTLRQVLAG